MSRFSYLVETISKKPIPAHVKALVVEVCVTDKEDNDVIFNFLLYFYLNNFPSLIYSRKFHMYVLLLDLEEKVDYFGDGLKNIRYDFFFANKIEITNYISFKSIIFPNLDGKI